MKQTEAQHGRNENSPGQATQRERSPGFNEQNKILPLLAERGEGRGEESNIAELIL
jgi:hypothetical protein